MDAILVVLLLLVVIVVIIAIWAVAMYNRLVRLRNLVQEAWRQIDVELHRRYDLIPNLVETVKGYAAHERGVFEEVTQARAAAATPGSSPGQQARHEDMLSNAIGRLFAVAEAYPQLRAAENFVQLQNELTNTEDRIAAGRRFYNANVRTLNTKVEVFPSNIVAGMFNFVRAEYFEVTDPAARQRPTVSFGGPGGPAGGAGYGQQPAQQPPGGGGFSHGGQPGGFPPGQQGGGQPGYPQHRQQQAPPQPPHQGHQPPQGQPPRQGYAPQQGHQPPQHPPAAPPQQSQPPQPPQSPQPPPQGGGYPQSPPPGPGQG